MTELELAHEKGILKGLLIARDVIDAKCLRLKSVNKELFNEWSERSYKLSSAVLEPAEDEKKKARACLQEINRYYPNAYNYTTESEYVDACFGFDTAEKLIKQLFNLSEGE